jgi:MFS family permease
MEGHTMFGRRTTVETDGDAAHRQEPTAEEVREENRAVAHQRFGGINWGAAFFGWLVAIAMTVLLAAIASAIAAAIGEEVNLTQSDVESDKATAGLAAAIIVIAIFAIAYYAGGYVAGRMSRFDGARQGLGVWIVGLLVTILAAVIGLIFGEQYNVLDRVNPPDINAPDDAGAGAIIAGVVLLVVTALTAMAGGKAGRHYHAKVDATRYPA